MFDYKDTVVSNWIEDMIRVELVSLSRSFLSCRGNWDNSKRPAILYEFENQLTSFKQTEHEINGSNGKGCCGALSFIVDRYVRKLKISAFLLTEARYRSESQWAARKEGNSRLPPSGRRVHSAHVPREFPRTHGSMASIDKFESNLRYLDACSASRSPDCFQLSIGSA